MQSKQASPGWPILRVVMPIVITLFLVCTIVSITCKNKQEQCYSGQLSEMPLGVEKIDQNVFDRTVNATTTAISFLIFLAIATFCMLGIIYLNITICFAIYAAVAIPLAIVTQTLMLLKSILAAFEVAIDWFTIALVTWNIVGTGIFTFTCLTPPKIIRQMCLIYISVVVAYLIVILFPPYTTWALLIVLVLWDLFAVLTPCGPLRLIVQLLNKRQAEDKSGNNHNGLPPILLYSTMAYSSTVISSNVKNSDTEKCSNSHSDDDDSPNDSVTPSSDPSKQHQVENIRPQLGLGDFIFYSLLVGKTMTMTRNIVTVLFVSLSVVVGLIFTLLLLFAYRQALPALPISLSIALVVLAVMSLSSEQFSQELNTRMLHI